jgi:hypothetical protein
MKKLVRFAAITAAFAALVACHPQPRFVEPAPPQESTPPVPGTPPPTPDPKAGVTAELELQLALERALRAETETRLGEQETAKSSWQTAALFAMAGGCVLLLIGAGVGASARHDAQNQKTE